MAFSNYSNLFRCGLLSEGSSPSCTSTPWATEYYGPRRGSLPPMDELPELSDYPVGLQPAPSSSGHETLESLLSTDEPIYFTFKKKRNHAEHRSFLSLDLAESQSLRSVSLKGKESVLFPSNDRRRQASSSAFSPTFNHSFIPMFSPPAPASPPGSPISANSLPDPHRSLLPEPSSSTQRLPTTIHAPSPRYASFAFPSSPTTLRRELSPMRFADPSPPLLHSGPVEIDATSDKSIMSADVLSRSSTVSTRYRRAQRSDALKRLEGRGADGAVGRLKPRLSQNFMSLSDDEDEEAETLSGGRSMNVIVEDLSESNEDQSPLSSGSQASDNRGLSVSINGQPWYHLTPRQNAWGVLFGGEVDGDIDTEVDKIFGLDLLPNPSLLQPDSPQSDDSCASRKPKRSKRSYSPRISKESFETYSFPKRTSTHPPAHLHPLDAPASSSSVSSSTKPSSRDHRPSKTAATSLGVSNLNARVRPRTVSDFGSSNPHTLVQEARTRRPSQKRKPRLEVHIDWHPTEEPSFIDMRDESLETESRSDSWHSLFEVTCAA